MAPYPLASNPARSNPPPACHTTALRTEASQYGGNTRAPRYVIEHDGRLLTAQGTALGLYRRRRSVLYVCPRTGLLRELARQPRASRDGVKGVREGALEVSLTAPPVEGEANSALVAYLAKRLGVAKRDVRIVQGETGRNKVLELRGVSAVRGQRGRLCPCNLPYPKRASF